VNEPASTDGPLSTDASEPASTLAFVALFLAAHPATFDRLSR
jgi:hypothetical protein